MPLIPSTFDLTFDNTFQGLLPNTPVIAADPCQTPGVNVCWLSHDGGFAYYPFRGNADTDEAVTSLGNYSQGGLPLDTQLESGMVQTIRAGSLTQYEAGILKGLFSSIRVWVLAPNSAGQIKAAPVHIERGTTAIWRDGSGRMNMEAKLVFPTQKGFRG